MTPAQLEKHKESNPFATLNDIIYDILLKDILGFNLKPGEKVNESTIAAELGISRSPVRKALQRLAENGYIQIKNSRYYVSEFTNEEYTNVMDLAVLLESYAMGEAAVKITSVELDELYEMAYNLQRLYRKALTENETVGYKEILDAENAFHSRIVEISGNNLVIEVYNQLFYKLFRYRSYLVYHPPAKLLKMIEYDHIILCDALKLGDRDVAIANGKRHLHITETLLVKDRWLNLN